MLSNVRSCGDVVQGFLFLYVVALFYCCFPNRVLKVPVENLAFLVQLEFVESLVTG